jgi:hypothetical protein
MHEECIEEIAFELYAAGPWGDFYAFVDDGARCVTDAHSMDTYREIVRRVLSLYAQAMVRRDVPPEPDEESWDPNGSGPMGF